MKHEFTLEYWQDDDWFVGRLKEVPGVFSQGETLAELERNIEDAYQLVMANGPMEPPPASAKAKPVLLDVR
jgi:predicted RNase H-like HicB family nuclease